MTRLSDELFTVDCPWLERFLWDKHHVKAPNLWKACWSGL